MKLPIEEQERLSDELRKEYREFMANLATRRDELLKELDKELDTERAVISKTMHDMYAKGLSKALIRTAVSKAGNPAGFNQLWNAYIPANEEIDLRTYGSRSAPAVQIERNWRWDGDTLIVTIDGDHETDVHNVRIEADAESGIEYVLFDGEFGDEWPQIQKAAIEAMKEVD